MTKKVFITGGTGSFGKVFVKNLLEQDPNSHITIFSRDELKQYSFANSLPKNKYPNLNFCIGDVRDSKRLSYCMKGHTHVVHAAALKHVPAAERNPTEFIKTNINGAINVIDACIEHQIINCVALSTDKACAPINLYGATKLCSDKLFISANLYQNDTTTKFAVVRYGNVMGSRGSVIPFFLNYPKNKPLPVTDIGMTRFNITLPESIETVFWAQDHCKGGEIVIPEIPSYHILDLVAAIRDDNSYVPIGIREGEKLHEEMITSSDSLMTLKSKSHYLILPAWQNIDEYINASDFSLEKVPLGFSYSSGTNNHFLTVNDLKNLLKDETFIQ